MSEKTKIQWADDTANFWLGCTKVSPGCANCYAEKNIGVKMSGIKWGKGQPRVKSKSAVADCLRWNKKPWICDGCGHATEHFPESCTECDWCGCHRRRVFSLSLGDWLDPEIPIEWLAEMLDTIRRCDQLIFILCTKRSELFLARINQAIDYCRQKEDLRLGLWLCEWAEEQLPPDNVWLLASVENQEMADKRIPELLKIPAIIRGLSLEPLLGPVDLIQGIGINWEVQPLHWLIIGGESGPGARSCNVEWIRALVAQGKSAGVATFVKQLGSNPRRGGEDESETRFSFEDKKGGDIAEWPEDLRVREFPEL